MNNLVDLRQLQCFIAVAEELHFGRAAQRLFIAQPALSHYIRRLEQTLSCKLFERKPRVELTEAGHVLFDVARRTVANLERGLEMTHQVGRGEIGTLKLGFIESGMLTIIPAIIRSYSEKFPGVSLHLRALSPKAELEAVRDGIVDVGFVREIYSCDQLTYEILVREPFVVLLPPGHHLMSEVNIPIENLAGEPFVHFSRAVAPALYDQVKQLCSAAGFAPKVAQEVHDWITHISLVEAGMGIALVPSSVQKLHWGGVCYKPLKHSSMEATIAICCRRGELRPIVNAFIRVARDAREQRNSAPFAEGPY